VNAVQRIVPFGEAALLVELEQRIDPLVAARAAAIADAWERLGNGRAIPAYASVLLWFDPLELAPAAAEEMARRVADAPPPSLEPREWEIPTRYDGPDLDEVARMSGLTTHEVIALHLSAPYRVFFLGFMPGFAYCGVLDGRIVAPRLRVPRTRVPAGSVAVAEGQTAVYPFASPGGWRLIGSTDVKMFDPGRDPPSLLRAGDVVRFARA
jgi:KipI family sensor histidine kinase inhibitor